MLLPLDKVNETINPFLDFFEGKLALFEQAEQLTDGLLLVEYNRSPELWISPKFCSLLGIEPTGTGRGLTFPELIVNSEHLTIPSAQDDPVQYYAGRGTALCVHSAGPVKVCIKLIFVSGVPGLKALYRVVDCSDEQMELILYRELEIHHRQLLEATNVGTWEWNVITGKMIYNERWAEIIGYTLEEINTNTIEFWRQNVHPDDRPVSEEALKAHFAGETPYYECVTRMKHRNGNWVWVLDKGKVLSRTPEGLPERISGTHQDITQIREKEVEANRMKEILKHTGKLAKIGTWELDVTSLKAYLDPVVLAMLEMKESNELSLQDGYSFFEIGEHRERIRQDLNRCIYDGIRFDGEYHMITAGNNELWARIIGIPVIEQNRVVRVHGLTQDITKTKSLLRSLEHQTEKFSQTFDKAPNGMAIVETDGTWLQANEALCQMLGYTRQELMQKTFNEITFPEDLEENRKFLRELSSGKREGYELLMRFYHQKGTVIWSKLSVSAVRDRDGMPEFFILQITDISMMKRAQSRLQETIQRLQSVYNATTEICIVEVNLDGSIRSINKGVQNMLGYTSEMLVDNQTHANVLFPVEYLERRRLELMEQTGDLPDLTEVLWVKPRSGFFDSREALMLCRDGSHKSVFGTITPIIRNENEWIGFLITAIDISELKAARDKIQHLLDLSQDQNERLMNFAHIVSHNLRSHAGNFVMLIDLMKLDVPEHTRHHFFPMLEASANALKETIEHLNEVVVMHSRISDNMEVLPLRECAEKSLQSIATYLAEKKAKVEIKIRPGLKVKAIPAYLSSIMHNLITNAAKYSSPNRKPRIVIAARKQGGKIELSVSDNGLGIDMKKHGGLLFHMYKTFHGNEDARGVGLFLIKNQIEAMGGEIHVTSEVNKGTTFTVILYAN